MFSDFKFDLVCSGVNKGNNLGTDVNYSGTVSAGLEANCLGLPAIAFSSTALTDNKFDVCGVIAMKIVDKLKDNNFWIIATDIRAKDNYYDVDYCDMNFAIVMGSEKEGISSTILKKADYRIKIPMLTEFDSLNVANAASIVIYESVKQTVQKSANSV
jgi:broad specificity polyphosphatase/5'/3'-nucleotidase SurE